MKWVLPILVVACGAPPPPPKPPPPMKHNPPYEADMGGHHLIIRLADSPVNDTSHSPPRVQTIEIDNNVLYPRDCAAKSKTKLLACSHAHRAVKDANDWYVVANHATENQLQILISARAGNNVECGALEYWVLRLDKSGWSTSEPVAGCFTLPSLDPDAQNPVIDWGPPLSVKTFNEKSNSCALQLGPGANVWSIKKSKKP